MEASLNSAVSAYGARLKAEVHTYHNCEDVHDLPDIFHYWSNGHIRPKLEAFGYSSPNDMFRKYIREQCRHPDQIRKRFVSIGSGNCDLEIQLALDIRAQGYGDFAIDCLDLNPAMLARGQAAAAKAGITSQMSFVPVDLNEWNPAHEYDAAIANQTLHHVLKLENLFAQVKRCLKPTGYFIISDMIGRNGHQRWPEALEIVHEFWRRLPPSYRFNRKLQRYEELYEDCDCSGEGFEGIRSQDVLPLLSEYFHFQFFLAFGNVIDPFVDRAFGFNFDASASWDQHFIDDVHLRDEEEIASGHLKPTHLLAAVRNNADTQMIFREPLTPEFCVRDRSTTAIGAQSHRDDSSKDIYDWDMSSHNLQAELEVACRRMKESQDRINEQSAHVLRLDEELEQRTDWALQLDKEIQERTAWALRLEKQVEERTAWALQMEAELGERTAWAMQLNEELTRVSREVEERTTWALELNRELHARNAQVLQLANNLEQLAWARAIDRYFHRYLDTSFRALRQLKRRISGTHRVR